MRLVSRAGNVEEKKDRSVRGMKKGLGWDGDRGDI